VVLSLLRQAIGTPNLPPTQVITSLSLVLTLLIMTPVWRQYTTNAVVPYTQHKIGRSKAWDAGVAPVRRFMSMQIERRQNHRGRVVVHELSSPSSQARQLRRRAVAGAGCRRSCSAELKTAF